MTLIPYTLATLDPLAHHLSQILPRYKVIKRFGNLQIRTSNFTLTGNVTVRHHKKKQRLKLSTQYDMLVLYWFVNWPIAIYLTVKKEKQQAMEQEVTIAIEKFLKKNC